MTIVKAYIRPNQAYSMPIRYTLRLMAQNGGFDIQFVGELEDAHWEFDHDSHDSEPIAVSFYEGLRSGATNASKNTSWIICDVNGQVDELASIFYMVNCIQERNPTADQLDRFGRFRYKASYQFANDSVQENLVQKIINNFLNEKRVKVKRSTSRIFVSHDVDFLYSSRKEDIKWAAQNWHLGSLMKIIFNEFIGKSSSRNIDQIIKLNSEYDIRSTFFWLVNEGIGSDEIPNADYTFRREKGLVDLVGKENGFNGLHKSASTDSFGEELVKSGQSWKYNRNHYLRFQTHDLWEQVEATDIKLDCSLGFAESIGFRNSYGKPFTPYDLKNDRPHSFVEMPLHVMDATFLHYMKTDPSQIAETVTDFLMSNHEDCVLSILWHNNYLSPYSYRSYLDAYKAILTRCHYYELASITPDEIIDGYLLR